MSHATKTKAQKAPKNGLDESVDGPLISLKELAKRVNVCVDTVRRWCTQKEPRLRRVKRFGCWRTKIKWYEDWLAAQNNN